MRRDAVQVASGRRDSCRQLWWCSRDTHGQRNWLEQVATARAARHVAPGEAAQLLGPRWRCLAAGNRARNLTACGLEQIAVSTGIQPEVTNFLKAIGEDMLDEAA